MGVFPILVHRLVGLFEGQYGLDKLIWTWAHRFRWYVCSLPSLSAVELNTIEPSGSHKSKGFIDLLNNYQFFKKYPE
jgi:hypothetical protein